MIWKRWNGGKCRLSAGSPPFPLHRFLLSKRLLGDTSDYWHCVKCGNIDLPLEDEISESKEMSGMGSQSMLEPGVEIHPRHPDLAALGYSLKAMFSKVGSHSLRFMLASGPPTWTMAPTIFRASLYSLSPLQWGFRRLSSVARRLCSLTNSVCKAASLGVSLDRVSP